MKDSLHRLYGAGLAAGGVVASGPVSVQIAIGLALCAALVFIANVGSADTTTPNANAVASGAAREIDFARDIQPILASKCIRCHGPETQEGGLRLDDPKVAFAELESGQHAVVVGRPDESELVRRVTTDASERMPPEEPPLEATQVAALRQWIAEGATWPNHWAYEPLKKVAPPTFENADDERWCREPIDRFILKGLLSRGMRPSQEADRRTLIRRVYFDVVGLPPTPEEVDAFVGDMSPDAYERVVDRLLTSPHYGERWARHWMDVVHYADSHGFEHDMPRNSWPYRDYLIQSLNADIPYAQFIREQVAGDVLSPDDPRAIAATGFLATGPWDQSALQAGQIDTDDYRISQYLDRDDIVSTIMSTFVSSTVHCARCHDHKFDPILQVDYYSLQAVVSGIDKATREYDIDPAVAKQRQALLARQAEVQRQVDSRDRALLEPSIQPEVADWERAIESGGAEWELLDAVEATSSNGSDLIKQGDRSIVASGPCPDKDVYTVSARTVAEAITSVRLEVLSDSALPQGGPGRQGNGNLHLTEFTITVAPANDPTAATDVVLTNPQADFNQMPGWTIADSLDRVAETGWGIYPEVGRNHTAIFQLSQPIRSKQPVILTFQLRQELGRQHLIGRFRLAVRGEDVSKPLEQSTFPEVIRAALAVESKSRTDEQRIQLAGFYKQRTIEAEFVALPKPHSVYCGTNRFKATGGLIPAAAPREVYVLGRGDIKSPLEPAKPGSLRCVTGMSGELSVANLADEGQRRVALADWLASPDNSLTWRSIANRVWQYHFGRGLVDTPNDFGRMGLAPSHPELLDWLATSLRDNGGTLKDVHRLILNSAVYRQSSESSDEAVRVDAENRLLSHMNVQRLDAESLRDAILVISRKLDPQLGGPPVKHFVEVKGPGMRPEANYQQFSADDPANNRRSIYRFLLRTMPDPLMSALDCPDGTQLSPARNVSITALQALAMLNDKFVIRQSQHIADRVANEAASTRNQVSALYREVLFRTPSEEEISIVAAYAERYGLANACRFLLNTNEFAFVN